MTPNTRLLTLLVAVLSIRLPLLSAEPNTPQVAVQFEIADTARQWVRSHQNEPGAGPIKPTHVAEIIIFEQSQQRYYGNPDEIKHFQATVGGRSISEKQVEFFTTSDAVAQIDNGFPIRHHRPYLLYAVSADEARAMAQAFLELSAAAADELMQDYVKSRDRLQTQVAACQKLVPQLQAKLQAAAARKKELESQVRYLSCDEATGAIQEMNSLLNSLRIEIDGIQSKIDEIHQSLAAQKHTNSQDLLAKLEELLVVETIDLKGAQARQKTADKIRQEAAAYVDAVNTHASLASEFDKTRTELENAQRELSNVEQELADPRPEMLPPIIYQNKVTIYPVRTPDENTGIGTYPG